MAIMSPNRSGKRTLLLKKADPLPATFNHLGRVPLVGAGKKQLVESAPLTCDAPAPKDDTPDESSSPRTTTVVLHGEPTRSPPVRTQMWTPGVQHITTPGFSASRRVREANVAPGPGLPPPGPFTPQALKKNMPRAAKEFTRLMQGSSVDAVERARWDGAPELPVATRTKGRRMLLLDYLAGHELPVPEVASYSELRTTDDDDSAAALDAAPSRGPEAPSSSDEAAAPPSELVSEFSSSEEFATAVAIPLEPPTPEPARPAEPTFHHPDKIALTLLEDAQSQRPFARVPAHQIHRVARKDPTVTRYGTPSVSEQIRLANCRSPPTNPLTGPGLSKPEKPPQSILGSRLILDGPAAQPPPDSSASTQRRHGRRRHGLEFLDDTAER